MITNDEIDEIFDMISKNIKYYRLNNKSKYADEFGRISQEKLADLLKVVKGKVYFGIFAYVSF